VAEGKCDNNRLSRTKPFVSAMEPASMQFFIWRIFTSLLLFLLIISMAAAADVPRPNVLFILADDLGYMDIGANNPKSFYETPNIDRLAARGMRFTQGYSACPVCSPTRASIMTGKYPPRTGITDYIGGDHAARMNPAPNQEHLSLDEVTIAERLRDAGYATFFAGKWHLGTDAFTPNAQGFGPGLQGSGQFYYPPRSGGERKEDTDEDPKTTDRIADAAVDFIETHKDKPFFAYLPFLAVHRPIQAAPRLVKKYEEKRKSAPADVWGVERECKVRLVQNDAGYAAMLEQLDTAVGRVVAALDRAGLTEKTVIVFTSDNGGLSTSSGHPTSNAPLRAGKGWPYEGGIRTPWIVVAPGVTKGGSVCDTPVITTDCYPTLLDLCGQSATPEQPKDGVSLVPLLNGSDLKRSAPLYWHYPHYGNQGGAPCGAIRDGEWKLVEWFEDGSLELFNLREDLGEQRNLAAEKPQKAKELQSQLAAWRKATNAVMPTVNPDFKASP